MRGSCSLRGSRTRRSVMQRRAASSPGTNRILIRLAILMVVSSLGCTRLSVHCIPHASISPPEQSALRCDAILCRNDPCLCDHGTAGHLQPIYRHACWEWLAACAQRSTDPFRQAWYRCQDKIARHREQAHAPPWPKFHPVPSEPAFTPRDAAVSLPPEAFGSFGPEG